jgi:hypothetical protein
MDNFQCSCGKTHFIPSYKTKVVDGELVHCDKKSGLPLKCTCKSKKNILIPIEREVEGFTGNIGVFSSMSLTEKQSSLAKRSKKHSDRFANLNDVKFNSKGGFNL